jgi:hypothetical protein
MGRLEQEPCADVASEQTAVTTMSAGRWQLLRRAQTRRRHQAGGASGGRRRGTTMGRDNQGRESATGKDGELKSDGFTRKGFL